MTDSAGLVVQSRAAAGSAPPRLDDRGEAHLQVLRRVASAPAAGEADVWAAIEAFADSERWAVVLEIIDHHEFDLDPWRMTRLRVRALFELGWHGRALGQLVKAHQDGYVRGCEAVEMLVEWSALALAARFVDEHMSGDLWREEARIRVLDAATRACAAASVHEVPLQYADAIQARHILLPGLEPIELAVKHTLTVLTANAGELLANDDPMGATLSLEAAVRLDPMDRSLLDLLADASRRANMAERYLDTLLRIWTTHREAPDLLAIARGVLDTSSWATISEMMAMAAAQAGLDGLDAVTDAYRQRACRKVDEYIRAGDVASGLELVITVSRQFPAVDWPHVLLARLLHATKRCLRNQQAVSDALIASLCPLYLELAPLDVDICRMMARLRLRQRRLSEARELLDRIVTISPHVAGDWIALAMVQTDMGDGDGRDLSVVRALLIAPDNDLPPVLAPVPERLGLV